VPGYELLGELGQGGMGMVYKARQKGLNRIVALKMLLPGVQPARFKTEAEASARLAHPNIVQVFDIGECRQGDNGPLLAYYSMEYCPGGNLDKQLKANPLPAPEAARLVEKLARAVQHAHEHGIIHRDLKPSNILLAGEASHETQATQAGASTGPRRRRREASDATLVSMDALVPKIADFGLAKKMDEQSHTRTGEVMGTPSYMAPEQAHGERVGPLADVWALGAILYECLTGRAPFKGATGMETMLQVLNQEPVPPSRLSPGIPLDLETICLKCLNKEPARRYESAEEMADDLGRFLAGEPIQARPLGTLGRLKRWVWRFPAVAGLIGTVALLLVLGMAVASLLAWNLSRSRGELQATMTRIEEQVAKMRTDVDEWRGKAGRADVDVKEMAAYKARFDKDLAELELRMARGEWHVGPKLGEMKKRQKKVGNDEEKTQKNAERSRGELEYRERLLRDFEEILANRPGGGKR
ncbi:MAG: serine/threonine protein kinase, partial [Gemmataceae bacterium]|nr:serine/threonine protein kinase [Gemmataceae bacterium]